MKKRRIRRPVKGNERERYIKKKTNIARTFFFISSALDQNISEPELCVRKRGREDEGRMDGKVKSVEL
jgi:hypothetical protein